MKNYDIDPDKLKLVFENTTATYKFYWFFALLDSIRAGSAYQTISFTELVARMMSHAWKPLLAGAFSFGKCDALLPRIQLLIFQSELKANDVEKRVFCYIMEHHDDPLIQELVRKMTQYVPYRFLYPWLGADKTNRETAFASLDFNKYRCPYGICKKAIQLNPGWIEYLTDHLDILYDFTMLNLLNFLKKHNDNIVLPDDECVSTTADGYQVNSFSQLGVRYVAEEKGRFNNDEVAVLKKHIRQQNNVLNSYQRILNLLTDSKVGCSMTFNGPVGQAIGHVGTIEDINDDKSYDRNIQHR